MPEYSPLFRLKQERNRLRRERDEAVALLRRNLPAAPFREGVAEPMARVEARAFHAAEVSRHRGEEHRNAGSLDRLVPATTPQKSDTGGHNPVTPTTRFRPTDTPNYPVSLGSRPT